MSSNHKQETKINIIEVISPDSNIEQVQPRINKKNAFLGVENPNFESSKDEDKIKNGKFRLSKYCSTKRGDLITYSWNNINVWNGSEENYYEKGIQRTRNSDYTNDHQNTSFCCWKKSNINSKQILKNVYGIVRPGELIAIMDTNGYEKTTLLNVLTFRNNNNNNNIIISGERGINGIPIGPDNLKTISAYIQRHDLFIGTLTVREHLTFQALVRMHPNIPYRQRIHRVEQVIQEVGLSKCADTKIGISGRLNGISYGEMKILAFASEILTDPPLIFCDEPTTGLNSFMAQNVINVLKNLSLKGKTIICTIEQPCSQVYEMFDRILLLGEGRLVYLGDTNNVIQFFNRQNYTCPQNYNPSDFFIQTLSIQPGNEINCKQIVKSLCDGFEGSPDSEEIRKILDAKTIDVESAEYLKLEVAAWKKKGSIYKANWMTQFRALFWRSWISYTRDPFILKFRFFQTIMIALLVGVFYYDQEYNQDGVQNINGVLFLFLIYLTLENIFHVINMFCLEQPIFLKEHWNGMYRIDTYFLAKILAEFPFIIIFPTLFLSINYYLIGFNPELNVFLKTLAIIILVGNTAGSFGYLISVVSSTRKMAMGLGSAIMIPYMLFGGYFLNLGSVPSYLIWIKYLSWFFYGNEALLIIQWDTIDYIDCNRTNETCPEDGHVIIQGFNFNKDNLQFDIISLIGLIMLYRVLAYMGLFYKTLKKNI